MTIERIQFRRGTAAAWAAANPVLAAGEPGHEIGTGREKRGDGVTAWNDLPYFAGVGGPGGGGVETVVAGAGVSVDSSDPASPVVSAVGAGDIRLKLSLDGDHSLPQGATQTLSWTEIDSAGAGLELDVDGETIVVTGACTLLVRPVLSLTASHSSQRLQCFPQVVGVVGLTTDLSRVIQAGYTNPTEFTYIWRFSAGGSFKIGAQVFFGNATETLGDGGSILDVVRIA